MYGINLLWVATIRRVLLLCWLWYVQLSANSHFEPHRPSILQCTVLSYQPSHFMLTSSCPIYRTQRFFFFFFLFHSLLPCIRYADHYFLSPQRSNFHSLLIKSSDWFIHLWAYCAFLGIHEWNVFILDSTPARRNWKRNSCLQTRAEWTSCSHCWHWSLGCQPWSLESSHSQLSGYP